MVTPSEQSAADIIAILGLKPHPEGGMFVETFRDQNPDIRSSDATPPGPRGWSTAIYYLLQAGEHSHWHRIDAAELWHYYAGGPLALTISGNGVDAQSIRVGPNIAAGERPQVVVPPNAWQTAEPLGRWTLVGCTVAPGFEFSKFELAPPDWRPQPPSPR